MTQRRQAESRLASRLAIVFAALLVTKFALEAPVDLGWIQVPVAIAFSWWAAAVLNVLLMLLLFAVIGVWPTSTGAERSGKLLILAYLVLSAVGGVARRLGWLQSQGRTVDTLYYALSTLAMLAILLGLMALAVKDLGERTTRDVQAKLSERETSRDESSSAKVDRV